MLSLVNRAASLRPHGVIRDCRCRDRRRFFMENDTTLTQKPGSHPLGTGAGAAGGAATGAVLGAVVAGPVGAAVGAAVGGVAGAAAGHQAGEMLNPTGTPGYSAGCDRSWNRRRRGDRCGRRSGPGWSRRRSRRGRRGRSDRSCRWTPGRRSGEPDAQASLRGIGNTAKCCSGVTPAGVIPVYASWKTGQNAWPVEKEIRKPLCPVGSRWKA